MKQLNITTISTDSHHISVFTESNFDQEIRGGMLLSHRIDAQNFRLRESEPGYETDWHLAGDPTLIIIRQGILRITLRNGSYLDFKAGDLFIAADNLPEDLVFDDKKHGHKAMVMGEETLQAVHIKLGSPRAKEIVRGLT